MSDGVYLLDGAPAQVAYASSDGVNGLQTAAMPAGGFVATWVQRTLDPGGNRLDIFVQIHGDDGSPIGNPIQVNATSDQIQQTPDIAVLNNGNFVVTWMDQNADDGDGTGIFMQQFTSAGVPIGSKVQVNSTGTGDQITPEIKALSDGGFAIAWDSTLEDGDGTFTSHLMLERFNSTGASLGSEITVATYSPPAPLDSVRFDTIEIAELTDGTLALSFTYAETFANFAGQLALVTSTGTVVQSDVQIDSGNDEPETLAQPSIVALGNGNVFVVYSETFMSPSGGFGSRIFGREFDAAGNAVGLITTIASGLDNSRSPVQVLSDGNGGLFVAYIERHETETDAALLVQQIDSNGVLQGDPIWVNTNAQANVFAPNLIALANGDLIAAWQDFNTHNFQLLANGTDGRFSTAGDVVTLGNGGESVAALEGDDTVTGGTGDDAIFGGSGEDTLSGGDGIDTLQGGNEDDTLNGDDGDDLLYGQAGADTINGGSGADYIDGGIGDDVIDGGDNDDTIFGGRGSDTLNGGAGDDTIHALRDFSNLGPNDPDFDPTALNRLNGDAGNDRLYGSGGSDIFNGGTGDDFMFGDGQNALATGVSGNDRFIGSAGNDILNGHGGMDLADYSGMTALGFGGINVRLDYFSETNNSNGFADISLTPTATVSFRQTLTSIEIIFGTELNDTLTTGNISGRFVAGLGTDTYSMELSTTGLEAYLNFGIVRGPDVRIQLDDVENLTGSDFVDRLIGDSNSNVLIGAGGDDIIKGKGGEDKFEGGDGNDTIEGGADVDIMMGENGEDILFGLAGNDRLDGGDNRDFLYGGRDQDVIFGGEGDDELRGNRGNDIMDGGIGSDDLRGGGGNDEMSGGDGNDFLFGENGEDILRAGQGNDSLTGGVGGGVADNFEDIFIFTENFTGGFNRIKDFEIGFDVMIFEGYGGDIEEVIYPNAQDTATGIRIELKNTVVFIENYEIEDLENMMIEFV